MAKFYHPSKLDKKEQEELLLDFCYVISSLSDIEKAAQFVKDLLSPQEAEMLAKRVKIAQLLVDGRDYNFIQSVLKVSPSTISRVNEWLKYSGDGYRFVARCLKERQRKRIEKAKLKNPLDTTASWKKLKRRFPLYFWPQLIIEEIIEGASKRQKQKLLLILEQIKAKPPLYKQIEKILKQKL